MSEHLTYHTIEELRALSIEELRALWELVPTDRQHRYQTVYQREVRTNGHPARTPSNSRSCMA